jgi:hypothetical protein
MGTMRIARLGRFFRPRSSWLSPLSVQCLPTTGLVWCSSRRPAGVRQYAVLGAERHCFGWAEHGEVQAGEERDEPFAATWADVADRREQFADFLWSGDDSRVDLCDAGVGSFPGSCVEGILRQPVLADRVLEDVVQDPAATAEVVRCSRGAVDLARQCVENQALGFVVLQGRERQRVAPEPAERGLHIRRLVIVAVGRDERPVAQCLAEHRWVWAGLVVSDQDGGNGGERFDDGDP